jgi:hypothetical protein
VVSGVLQWKEGAIQTEGLGTVRVTPEAVDALVLRKDEDKDGRSAFAAMVMTQSGEVRALAEIPQGMARLRWPGGGLQLPWEEIESVRQLPLPDLGQEAWLKDGSRIRGWFGSDDPALADCAVYARTWTALQQGLEAAKGSGSSNDQAPKEPHLRTHHDSLIVGRWGQPVVAVSAAAGPIEVPVEEIRKLRVQSGEGDQDQILLEIATAAGGVVKGAAVTDAVRWNHGEQMLSLPWSSVAEIVQTPNVPISK